MLSFVVQNYLFFYPKLVKTLRYSYVINYKRLVYNLYFFNNFVFYFFLKRNLTYRFSTVGYDNQLFRDYVIDQTKTDKNGLETESAKRRH